MGLCSFPLPSSTFLDSLSRPSLVLFSRVLRYRNEVRSRVCAHVHLMYTVHTLDVHGQGNAPVLRSVVEIILKLGLDSTTVRH